MGSGLLSGADELSSGLLSVVLEELSAVLSELLSELLEAVDDEDDVVDDDDDEDDDEDDDDDEDVDDELLSSALEDEFPFPLHAVSAAAIRTAVIPAVILFVLFIFVPPLSLIKSVNKPIFPL